MTNSKKKQRVKLFQVDGEYSNYKFNIKMSYYLRATSKQIIEKTFNDCKNFEGSMYYGFTVDSIKEISMKNIPEVKVLEIKH